MRKYTLLLLTASLISSCYTYKTYDPETALTETVTNEKTNSRAVSVRQAKVDAQNTELSSANSRTEMRANAIENKSKTSPSTESKQDTKEVNTATDIVIKPKTIIKDKGYYQLDVFDKTHKIEAVKWQGDTLISHVKGQPKKELKFHEKDIQNLKVRQFSKGRSDALTVAAYATAGVGLFLILK